MQAFVVGAYFSRHMPTGTHLQREISHSQIKGIWVACTHRCFQASINLCGEIVGIWCLPIAGCWSDLVGMFVCSAAGYRWFSIIGHCHGSYSTCRPGVAHASSFVLHSTCSSTLKCYIIQKNPRKQSLLTQLIHSKSHKHIISFFCTMDTECVHLLTLFRQPVPLIRTFATNQWP